MKSIYVLDKDGKIKLDLEERFKKEQGIKIKKLSQNQIEKGLKNIPDILVIDEDSIEDDILEHIKKIRNDEENSITPIVMISSNHNKDHIIEILKNEVEMYIEKPVDKDILYYNVKNIMRLLDCNRMVNPLTGLPGNVQIQAEMKKRLSKGKEFAILYVDLDNFKAYNDTYGFSNGDEVIKFTAKVIQDNILKEEYEQNFVGHIGGDDFIAITEGVDYEKIAQGIITEFDAGLSKFFSKKDYEQGFLEVENRKGIMEEYPLTSVSIGIVDVTRERFKNILEIGEAGASVKHLAKTIYGSTYVIDRRKSRDKVFKNMENKKIN